ncbi:TfoX/Sxy family protein [Emticicia sp. BO119]|uniref:TfoX/Sxy family protein n=1 Tax=Emticicia sp. BO119 TaxID=2757768 RepID=UPI0015F0A042|nr:TfoX/Sxy family protein [Emticicia sp. BO119]MBA4849537.1 TfoX/Sxy family protein [Emticicia sp. BO119]
MPYSENFLNRIREILIEKQVEFSEKKMFSGVCIMVDDKMCCGTHIDKKTGEDLMLCRIGDDAYEMALESSNCIPMEFTGKAMKGYVYVTGNGFRTQKDLTYWIQLCLDFNPFAKKSKK